MSELKRSNRRPAARLPAARREESAVAVRDRRRDLPRDAAHDLYRRRARRAYDAGRRTPDAGRRIPDAGRARAAAGGGEDDGARAAAVVVGSVANANAERERKREREREREREIK